MGLINLPLGVACLKLIQFYQSFVINDMF